MLREINTNTLFYGDNLPILREYLASESVDLIYLDPPFNSNRSYNVLFKQARRTDNTTDDVPRTLGGERVTSQWVVSRCVGFQPWLALGAERLWT